MIKDLHISEIPRNTRSMNPKMFILWLFMTTIIMLFAAFTSAYIVRQSEGNWVVFELPMMFYYSTGILLISSFTIHFAYISAKRDNLNAVKLATIVTFILGIAFVLMQYVGWGSLVEQGVYFVGNPSGSFLKLLRFDLT